MQSIATFFPSERPKQDLDLPAKASNTVLLAITALAAAVVMPVALVFGVLGLCIHIR